MTFKIGDRVITNKEAFIGAGNPNMYQGKSGKIIDESSVFDWLIEVDDPSPLTDGQWLVNTNEIDLLED